MTWQEIADKINSMSDEQKNSQANICDNESGEYHPITGFNLNTNDSEDSLEVEMNGATALQIG